MAPSPALRVLVGAVFLLAAACGGGDDGPSAPDAGGGTPSANEIFGGERLGWNQTAPSSQTVRSYTFNLYVDGTRSSLSDVRCGDVAGATGYECSGVLPTMEVGTRTLQVSATFQGREGARSAPLTVTVGRRMDTSATAPVPTGDSSRSREGRNNDPGSSHACFDAEPRACYEIQRVVDGLGVVTSLTSLPDGRVLFVEDAQRVRVLTPTGLLDEAAFTAERGIRILRLALHPQFSRNGIVYTASTRPIGERYAVTVQRHRELENTLGETATVLADIPTASPDVQLTVSTDTHIYVALPVSLDSQRRSGPYDGHVLRFAEDGSVPRDARGGSPLFSHGYAEPTALATSVHSSELWMSGSGGAVGGMLARVHPRQADWPRLPSPIQLQSSRTIAARAPVRAMSFGTRNAAQPTILYVTDSPGILNRLSLDADDFHSVIAVASLRYAADHSRATSLTTSRDDAVHIAVTLPGGLHDRAGQILRLRRHR